MATEDLWLTRHEVAARLKVHIRTVDRWAAVGGGPPYYKLRGHLKRYKRDEVDAWAAQDLRLHTADDGQAAQLLAEAEQLARRRAQ